MHFTFDIIHSGGFLRNLPESGAFAAGARAEATARSFSHSGKAGCRRPKSPGGVPGTRAAEQMEPPAQSTKMALRSGAFAAFGGCLCRPIREKEQKGALLLESQVGSGRGNHRNRADNALGTGVVHGIGSCLSYMRKGVYWRGTGKADGAGRRRDAD